MNKLIVDGADGKMVLCILEPANLHKLQQGSPIEFSLNGPGMFPQGLPAKLSIGIAFSSTPIADAKTFQGMTKEFVDERTATTMAKRPHCPECHSTVEQLMVWREAPPAPWLICCPACGCVLGATPPIAGLEKTK